MGEHALLGVQETGAMALGLSGKDECFVPSKAILALVLTADELGNYSMSDFENSAQR